ncbi:hypothetical protein HPB52_010421 [Rhipicephalus sanguineus]|uniref:Uncharacterized protein n=1 Tax=Rhipicephalus sanguineus TaxID=34632 RepID=A0A9D4SY81_RHISA|nr:hypothetical protein HPB52_010421 [Rhipicephalus sanguineus]
MVESFEPGYPSRGCGLSIDFRVCAFFFQRPGLNECVAPPVRGVLLIAREKCDCVVCKGKRVLTGRRHRRVCVAQLGNALVSTASSPAPYRVNKSSTLLLRPACRVQVARTRLRQEGDKYRSFFQTLFLVWREEGYQGLYRGLATQLVRQIPNTAIMMATYEAVVYMLSPAVYGASPANDD